MINPRLNIVVNTSITLNWQFIKNDILKNVYQLVKVEIYSDYDAAVISDHDYLVETITTILNPSIGIYQYSVSPLANAKTYYDKVYYKELVDSNEQFIINSFLVAEEGAFNREEMRLGFAFNHPDTQANNGWRAIITPDELRFNYAFGNELIAPNAQTITDDTLKWYIDNAVAMLERDLKVTLRKKRIMARPVNGQTRSDLTNLTEYVDFEYEEPYDFDAKVMQEYIYIKLRKRPLLSVQQVIWKDVAGGTIIDLSSWMRINYEKGSLQFFPNAGGLANLPLSIGNSSIGLWNAISYRGRYPDAFYIDYYAGFNSAAQLRAKHSELFQITGMLAAVNLLNDLGLGKSPGIASSSVSLAGISESFSTTQSAENSLYGATIRYYRETLKQFYKMNGNKYSGLLLGSL